MLTRAQAEGMVLSRCQAVLSRVYGADVIPAPPTAPASPCAPLGWPIAAALLDCRAAVADPSDPQDSELAALDPSQWPKFWDCAEYRALAGGLSQFTETSARMGNLSYDDSDLGTRLQKAVEFKAAQIKERYGVGAFNPGNGTIGVGQIPPYTPRPMIPPGQNWPPRGGFGHPLGYGVW